MSVAKVIEITSTSAKSFEVRWRYQAGTGPTLIKTSEILFAGIATSSSRSSPVRSGRAYEVVYVTNAPARVPPL